jgi:hypothetical protein
MGEENRIENPTQTLFPQMMQATKLLILDYDVTRYHSFDLFRYLLLDRELFMKCDPKFIPMIKETDPYIQIKQYMKLAPSINPYDNFTHLSGKLKIVDMEDRINTVISDEAMHYTYTDLYHNLGIAFDRNGINGYILKYKNDPHTVPWEDNVKVYTTDYIFDFAMTIAIIKKHRINAIMVSSVDAAVILCEKLEKEKYYDSITFMIGNYPYNYTSTPNDQDLNRLKQLDYLRWFEQNRKHEFGLFDPFSFVINTKE